MSRLTHLAAQHTASTQVVIQVATDFDLEVTPAACFQVAAFFSQSFV
jgi:hypothetical protein